MHINRRRVVRCSRARIFPLVVLLTVRSAGTSLSLRGRGGGSGVRRRGWSRFELFRVCVSATMIAVSEDELSSRFCRVVGRFGMIRFFQLQVFVCKLCRRVKKN